MKQLLKIVFLLTMGFLWGDNQTPTTTPVLPEAGLPFTIEIEEASFALPTGLQAYARATYNNKWVLLAGRTNGLHGFASVGNNFPPQYQNTTVYVVDPAKGITHSRSLVGSGLTQDEIDILSVVAPQSCQNGSSLYIVGGYGINTTSGLMETKNTLTQIDLKKLVSWVETGAPSIKKAIQMATHEYLRVTGGALFRNTDHDPFLLIVGQNFAGLYTSGSNGIYTDQIRSFWLQDINGELAIIPHQSATIDPDYRRRDLPVAPILNNNESAYVAFGGVFTLSGGVWTVPIFIQPQGESSQDDPLDPSTFKQGMNHYECPKIGLYSTRTKEMYVVLPGGLSYGYFSGGVFQTDSEVPFINQVTTININKKKEYAQFIMDNEYPFIASTGTNPGNQLLFGTEARFFHAPGVATFRNDVIQLDTIKKPTVIGYIVGGIMSTLPNTVTPADSTSSPYIFTVKVVPR